MERIIYDFLEGGNYVAAAELLCEKEAQEIAAFIASLERDTLLALCHEMRRDTLAEILPLLPIDKQQLIIDSSDPDELAEIKEELPAETLAEMMERLPVASAFKITDANGLSILLRERKFPVVKALLAEMNEVDIARIFDEMTPEEALVLFRLLPKDLASDAFVEMDPDTQEALLSRFSNKELHSVMEELFVDDVVDIVEEMPANVVKRMLAQSDSETRAYVNELLRYPEDSAGSIMTVEFVCLQPDMTVEDAYTKIRETAIDKETIYTCYVVDKGKRLIGIVTAKDLLLSPKDKKIEEIMETNLVYAHTTDDREDAVRLLTEYGFLAIPVVDDERRLVGIVTVDDAIDVLQEENTEDITKMAAVKPSDRPYLKTGVLSIWRNRLPWLLVLMISATFTGLILNTYESKLAVISTVLFACVPMIMDTGGNAGSQASVTVIRALALNELSTKDVMRVLWKEVRVSILLGASLALACFGKLMLIDNLLFGFADYTPFTCAVVSLALLCTVVIAKIVGCLLPLLAKKVKLDPAVVASPFITTIVDALSLILYCALAVALLGGGK